DNSGAYTVSLQSKLGSEAKPRAQRYGLILSELDLLITIDVLIVLMKTKIRIRYVPRRVSCVCDSL
ncbi:hypothetical protein, partial [Treponema socranskii]|uniref:hypothetical protein n=1 Tax=Treponema socranskii TaxID=53419 RepID=UPI003D9164CF